jgi:glycosyltransferase involved in cell wall biosynthesis
MKLMFVHHVLEDRGSAQDMFYYIHTARRLGHEIALYGPPFSESAFTYSLDIDSADAVIFIFEWTTDIQYGNNLDLTRVISRIPRERRVVIDCDGKYNDAIRVLGDINHRDTVASLRWVEICDSLSDKIFQPTLHPLRRNVRPFFFHAYNPAWEVPLDFSTREYGMVYVGNNWFRWRALERVLKAIEPIREQVGRIGLIGSGWDSPPPWSKPTLIEDAYYTDAEYLQGMDVDVMPPVQFSRVIEMMGRGIFSPVIYRPLFDYLSLVTCRTFETPAANTIPLFAQDPTYVEEIYGKEGLELVLPEKDPEEKILDLLRRPQYYQKIVLNLRRHLANKYSYSVRLNELIQIVQD